MSEIKRIGGSWVTNWFFGFNQASTNEDSIIYMKAVLCCAKGDGVLSQEQKDWALGFCASWEVEDWVIKELETYEANEDIKEVIARSPQVLMAQRDIILSAIWVSAANGKYQDQEKKRIRHMAAILGVTEAIVEQLEQHKRNQHYDKSGLNSYILKKDRTNNLHRS